MVGPCAKRGCNIRTETSEKVSCAFPAPASRLISSEVQKFAPASASMVCNGSMRAPRDIPRQPLEHDSANLLSDLRIRHTQARR